MKQGFKQSVRLQLTAAVTVFLLGACTATVKVPKHPAPGAPPPPPPKIEIHNN